MADGSIRFPSPRCAAPTPASQRRKMSAKSRDTGNRDSQGASRSMNYARRTKIAMSCGGRRAACISPKAQPRRLPPQLRKPHVLARIPLEVQRQGILRVRLDHFLHELHVNRVLTKNGVLVHRLEIDGNEERPG